MKREEFDELNDMMKESAYANAFIKDYILRFRFADIANNAIEYTAYGSVHSYNTTERICEEYDAEADKIIDGFNNDMRTICGVDNVKTKCENNNLMGLKKEIDETKQKYFEKILYQYNHVENFGYNSGRLTDQMLYTEYLNYITSDEFYYDDENPYVVELLYHITSFISMRSRLEFNSSNIAGLITNFNTLCDDNIKKYWDDHMYDYYGRMKEIFLYDFYTDDDNDLIQAKIDDKKRTTLYSKVMKYLEALCGYVKPRSEEEKYKDMDVDSIINNAQVEDTESEKEMKQLYNNLRKIAIFFVQLRKIENDTDPDYFKQYISEDDYNDLFTLKDELNGLNLREYAVQYNNSLTNVVPEGAANPFAALQSTYLSLEKKYTEPFKRLTQSEAKILRNLSDKAIKFYLDNDQDINSGKAFNKYKEAKWGGKSLIMKDNISHDFYYIEEPTTTEEDLASPLLNGGTITPKNDNDSSYNYTEDSLKTMYGVPDYEYWVKYCGVATIVNCMLPMYWPTGLVIAGTPIPMPIVYIPYVVISGRVTVVIGLGVCGICPLPMLLFVNMCDMPGSLIPAINSTIDTLRSLVAMLPSLSMIPIKQMIMEMVEIEDNKISEFTRQRNNIQQTIKQLQESVQTDKETLRNLKKRRKENSTSTSKKKKSNE